MGLVRNLKKRLSNLVDKILVELSYHYIIQRARQTTKKQDNSSKTKSLQSSLTTEPQSSTIVTSYQDISEKITMEQSPEATLYDARKWSMDRISTAEPVADKNAIYKEFEEWIEIEPDDEDMEVLYLENLSEYYKD
mgnify:FL=1|tara:strand:- start:76 stop:483 length:408 start_codon:yes stop_codon:yes gene_type:complete